MDYEDDMIRVLLPGHTEDNPKFQDIDISGVDEDMDDYLDERFGIGQWQGYRAVPAYGYDWRQTLNPKLKKSN